MYQSYSRLTRACILLTNDNNIVVTGNNDNNMFLTTDTSVREFKITCPNPNDRPLMYSTGTTHAVLLTEKGDLCTFGTGNFRGAGENVLEITDIKNSVLRSLPFDSKTITLISCGRDHTILLDSNGKCFAFGQNGDAQCGKPSNVPYVYVPTLLTGNGFEKLNAIDVSCGRDHTIITVENQQTKSHDLWGLGWNSQGQIGIGSNSGVVYPISMITSFPKIDSICCGSKHTLVLADGQVHAAGNHFNNVLTKQSINHNIILISSGYDHSIILSDKNVLLGQGVGREGQLPGISENSSSWKKLDHPKTNIIGIACCWNNSFLLDSNFKLYGAGDNSHQELGTPEDGFKSPQKTWKECTISKNIKNISGFAPDRVMHSQYWSTSNHHRFNFTFQKMVLGFLLLVNRLNKSSFSKNRIPRVIVYHIIRKI